MEKLIGKCRIAGALAVALALVRPVYPQQSVSEVVLYSFSPATGDQPDGGVIGDGLGNLYGTTSRDGAGGYGTVYKLDSNGQQTVLYNFLGGADGCSPLDKVSRDNAGNLFGAAQCGSAGFGVIFQVDPSGQEKVLYTFSGGADGKYPAGYPILDPAGNLYGTTQLGGAIGAGTVYKLDRSGNLTVLHSFTTKLDGAQPYDGVLRDEAGNLYGTASAGGSYGNGVVYKIDPSGKETVLYNFQGRPDGDEPFSRLIRDGAGNFYGTTVRGGAEGTGTVFKLDPTGHEVVLHSFDDAQRYGSYWNVTLDAAGNLYGIDSSLSSRDIVYRIDADTHAYTVLYTFNGQLGGGDLDSGLSIDAQGSLYGTALGGGGYGGGVLYKLVQSAQPGRAR